jgi:hypothetical protein
MVRCLLCYKSWQQRSRRRSQKRFMPMSLQNCFFPIHSHRTTGSLLSCSHRAFVPIGCICLPRPCSSFRCTTQPFYYGSKGLLQPLLLPRNPQYLRYPFTCLPLSTQHNRHPDPSQRVFKSLLWLAPANLKLLFANPGLKASAMQVGEGFSPACAVRSPRVWQGHEQSAILYCLRSAIRFFAASFCNFVRILFSLSSFRQPGELMKVLFKSPRNCLRSWHERGGDYVCVIVRNGIVVYLAVNKVLKHFRLVYFFTKVMMAFVAAHQKA